jgi:hypothetical protein
VPGLGVGLLVGLSWRTTLSEIVLVALSVLTVTVTVLAMAVVAKGTLRGLWCSWVGRRCAWSPLTGPFASVVAPVLDPDPVILWPHRS